MSVPTAARSMASKVLAHIQHKRCVCVVDAIGGDMTQLTTNYGE